nr:RNA-directed DNA polymerase, eukaryota [Tanacetum cinerariifolium]
MSLPPIPPTTATTTTTNHLRHHQCHPLPPTTPWWLGGIDYGWVGDGSSGWWWQRCLVVVVGEVGGLRRRLVVMGGLMVAAVISGAGDDNGGNDNAGWWWLVVMGGLMVATVIRGAGRPNHSTPKETNMENSKKSFVSVLKRGSQSHVTLEISQPAFVLDETYIKEFDFGMSLMRKAKDVYAILNIPCIISNEDDQDDLFSNGESQEGDVANKADNNKSDVDRVSESSFMHENDTAHKDMFDHVVGSSVDCLGGILCMWNPNMFVKEQVSTCDYLVALMGTWAPTSSSKLLIISVYAPQELNERPDLWDYLRTFIDRWEGDTVIIGDFNEVCSEHERFGSTFNRQGAIAFHNFISSACSIDLPRRLCFYIVSQVGFKDE